MDPDCIPGPRTNYMWKQTFHDRENLNQMECRVHEGTRKSGSGDLNTEARAVGFYRSWWSWGTTIGTGYKESNNAKIILSFFFEKTRTLEDSQDACEKLFFCGGGGFGKSHNKKKLLSGEHLEFSNKTCGKRFAEQEWHWKHPWRQRSSFPGTQQQLDFQK